jgi:hypothetical protein
MCSYARMVENPGHCEVKRMCRDVPAEVERQLHKSAAFCEREAEIQRYEAELVVWTFVSMHDAKGPARLGKLGLSGEAERNAIRTNRVTCASTLVRPRIPQSIATFDWKVETRGPRIIAGLQYSVCQELPR